MKPTLVVMAAGMGSRYGGLKQIDPIGPSGEIVIDYSVFDAIRAGFGKVVFVIRKDIEQPFKEAVEPHFRGRLPIDYTFQALEDIPAGFSVPAGRTKPWGTGQAILTCKDVVKEPFGVINADDFYGRESFVALANSLNKRNLSDASYVLIGFKLANTLSEHGSVSRGLCETGAMSNLLRVTELTSILRKNGSIVAEVEGKDLPLKEDDMVSMNMWGFTPALFPQLAQTFSQFLREKGGELKSEFYIPGVVDTLLRAGLAQTEVVPTTAKWLGMTYTEDKPLVRAGIQALIEKGEYPARLWS